jgi:hypothetical protein
MEIRKVLSWLLGIALFVFMTFTTSEISKSLGITTYIDYGETITISHRLYDEDRDGHQTGFGWFFILLSISVAIRGGMAFYTKTLSGGVSTLGNTQLSIVLGGVLAYGVTNQIIYFVLELNSFFGTLLDAASAIGILYLGFTIYQKRKYQIDQDS